MSDISVTVTLPDGLPAAGATVWLRPETNDEFEAYLEALGGLVGAHMNESFVSVQIDGGDAFLYYPRDLKPPVMTSPVDAFRSTLVDRQRDARKFMQALEDAAALS